MVERALHYCDEARCAIMEHCAWRAVRAEQRPGGFDCYRCALLGGWPAYMQLPVVRLSTTLMRSCVRGSREQGADAWGAERGHQPLKALPSCHPCLSVPRGDVAPLLQAITCLKSVQSLAANAQRWAPHAIERHALAQLNALLATGLPAAVKGAGARALHLAAALQAVLAGRLGALEALPVGLWTELARGSGAGSGKPGGTSTSDAGDDASTVAGGSCLDDECGPQLCGRQTSSPGRAASVAGPVGEALEGLLQRLRSPRASRPSDTSAAGDDAAGAAADGSLPATAQPLRSPLGSPRASSRPGSPRGAQANPARGHGGLLAACASSSSAPPPGHEAPSRAGSPPRGPPPGAFAGPGRSHWLVKTLPSWRKPPPAAGDASPAPLSPDRRSPFEGERPLADDDAGAAAPPAAVLRLAGPLAAGGVPPSPGVAALVARFDSARNSLVSLQGGGSGVAADLNELGPLPFDASRSSLNSGARLAAHTRSAGPCGAGHGAGAEASVTSGDEAASDGRSCSSEGSAQQQEEWEQQQQQHAPLELDSLLEAVAYSPPLDSPASAAGRAAYSACPSVDGTSTSAALQAAAGLLAGAQACAEAEHEQDAVATAPATTPAADPLAASAAWHMLGGAAVADPGPAAACGSAPPSGAASAAAGESPAARLMQRMRLPWQAADSASQGRDLTASPGSHASLQGMVASLDPAVHQRIELPWQREAGAERPLPPPLPPLSGRRLSSAAGGEQPAQAPSLLQRLNLGLRRRTSTSGSGSTRSARPSMADAPGAPSASGSVDAVPLPLDDRDAPAPTPEVLAVEQVVVDLKEGGRTGAAGGASQAAGREAVGTAAAGSSAALPEISVPEPLCEAGQLHATPPLSPLGKTLSRMLTAMGRKGASSTGGRQLAPVPGGGGTAAAVDTAAKHNVVPGRTSAPGSPSAPSALLPLPSTLHGGAPATAAGTGAAAAFRLRRTVDSLRGRVAGTAPLAPVLEHPPPVLTALPSGPAMAASAVLLEQLVVELQADKRWRLAAAVAGRAQADAAARPGLREARAALRALSLQRRAKALPTAAAWSADLAGLWVFPHTGSGSLAENGVVAAPGGSIRSGPATPGVPVPSLPEQLAAAGTAALAVSRQPADTPLAALHILADAAAGGPGSALPQLARLAAAQGERLVRSFVAASAESCYAHHRRLAARQLVPSEALRAAGLPAPLVAVEPVGWEPLLRGLRVALPGAGGKSVDVTVALAKEFERRLRTDAARLVEWFW